MKLLPFSTLIPVLGSVACAAHAAPLTFYTYDVFEALPCNSANCPDNTNIGLQGTITTDGLGTLAARDIVVWDLTFTLTGQTPIRITQSSGGFATKGSTQIQATSTDLTLTLNTLSDGFTFTGSTATAAAFWYYASSAQQLGIATSPNDQYFAQQKLTLPSTLTAAAVSTTAVPEPASLGLVFLAACVGLAVAKARHGKRSN